MGSIGYILTGGFLAGYRTYIMGGLVVASAVAGYTTGETNLVQTIEAVSAGLGINALRAAVPSNR